MIICADDFGMADDINRATVELAQAGKIDTVSCMVDAPFFSADTLAELGSSVKLGLHFTLVETPTEFRRLVLHAYTHRISRQNIYDKLSRQFDRFKTVAGRNPDFIDGHLHVQQLSVVRDVVIGFIKENCGEPLPAVRNSAIPLQQCSLKSLFISLPGRALKRRLQQAGIPTNDGFGGIYDYRDFMSYPQHLEFFFSTVSDNGIIMVHPGLNEPWRRAEYDALRLRQV